MLKATVGLNNKAAFAMVADMREQHVEMLSAKGVDAPLQGMKRPQQQQQPKRYLRSYT